MRTVVGIRSDKRARQASSHTEESTPTVWFDSWRQLAGLLSDENRALLRLMRERQPRTVLELAEWSGRAASNLSRTLRHLERHGLVKLHRSPDTRAVRPEALATERLAKMNLAVRGIDADIRWNNEGSFHKDELRDLRFDHILANPPFNISDWGGDRLREDPRWQFGVPPVGNANYAWLQHIHWHLAPFGTAGVVLANGSMSSNQSGEGEIRKAMVEADAVDCMVALPGQLFYSTQIPACLWFLARDKSNGKRGNATLRDRRGEVLFIDARNLGTLVDRTRRELTEADIQKIADTYHAWRGTVGARHASPLPEYRDIPGFCKSATLDDIRKHGHVLTPGRYVGAEAAEDDGEAFVDKMQRLSAQWREQQQEAARLDAAIEANLKELEHGG